MPSLAVRISIFGALGLSLWATPSFAGLLQSAELRFKIHGIPDGVIAGVGVSGEATSSTSVVVDAGSGFNGVTTQAVSAPHLHVEGNDAGFFSGISVSALGGNLRVFGDWGPQGVSKQTIFFPLLEFGISAANTSGTAIASAWPWTVGTTSVTGVSLRTPGGGLTPGSVTGKGTNNLTPLGSGTLVMVAPIYLSAPGWGRAPTGVIAELTLVFVPEPGTIATLSAGAVLLAVLARRRARERDDDAAGREFE
jgi:hypothetical protein